jgi:tetratricopeptide (TPR) repeat protein
MKLNKFIIICIFLLTSKNLLSSNLENFKQANDYFNAGKYELSADLYSSLIDSGYKESEIYFNLGNSYFRLNNIPAAILNFERAKRLNPNDEDIDFNLKLANLKIVDKFEPVPKLFFLVWFEEAIALLYSGVWGYVIVGSIWIFFTCLLCLFIGFAPKLRTWFLFLMIASLILSGAAGLFGYKAFKYENSQNAAIIFNPSVYVKSAPDPGSTDLFILHEGTKIHIMETIDKWIQIKVENGNIGWIKQDEIQII